MRKFVIVDTVSTKRTGEQVFLKEDGRVTFGFDNANIFTEPTAKKLKKKNDKLELHEVNVSLA